MIAAIGPGTAERLRDYHLNADLVPETFTAEGLAAALEPSADGGSFLLARANRGRDILAERLRGAGATVTQVVVYSSEGVDKEDSEVVEALDAGRIEWVIVASSETARSLHRLYGQTLGNARLVSISPLTTAALQELGHEPAAEATEHTMLGIAEAILRSYTAVD